MLKAIDVVMLEETTGVVDTFTGTVVVVVIITSGSVKYSVERRWCYSVGKKPVQSQQNNLRATFIL